MKKPGRLRDTFGHIGELEKSSILLFAVMMAGSFFNYLFQIIMGSMLSVEDYGRLAALLSLTTFVLVISNVIAMVTAKYTVEYAHNGRAGQIRQLFFTMSAIITVFAVAFTALGFIFAPVISRELKIGSDTLVVFTVVTASINLYMATALGILQGQKRFFHYGLVTFLSIFVKLIFSVLLVLIGWRLFGPVAGILLGTVIAFLYALFRVKDQTWKDGGQSGLAKLDWRRFLQFFRVVFVAQICLTLITNGDILLVKYFFSSQEAGLYSSAMVIGKISLYAATAIVAALFPMTMEYAVKGQTPRKLLAKSLLYTLGIAVMCVAVLNIFAEQIIGFLFGSEYLPAAKLMLPISALVIPVTIFTVMMNYQLAIEDTGALCLVLICCIIGCVVLVQFFHTSVSQMIYCLAIVLAAGAMADAVALYFHQK